MTAIDHSTEHKDPAYGWVMVAVVFTLSALSFGALGAISVFLKPLAAEFAWSRAQTSLGYTAIAFSSALFGILWGVVADRFGTRWFGVVGTIVMALSLYLLSKQTSIYQFYAFYFLFGAFGNAMVSTPLFANVGFWFRYKPGLALGITAAGGAIGQGIVPFLAGIAISAYGWQTAYMLMAMSYFLIAFPVAFLVRESPLREQIRKKPKKEQLLEERHFPLSEKEVVVWMSVAVIFCCNCMSVPIVHLVPMLTDDNRTIEFATSVLLVLMLAGGVGRIMGGKLSDSIGALPTYIIMSAGQSVSVFFFPHIDQAAGIYLLAVFFGFTYSGVMSSILVCVRMMVSARFAARAMSMTSFFGWSGMGMGGYFGGLFFDVNGDYELAFSFAAFMGLINLIILAMFYMRVKAQRVHTNLQTA